MTEVRGQRSEGSGWKAEGGDWGFRILDCGLIGARGFRGSEVLGSGFWVLGSEVLGSGFIGFWMLDAGYWLLNNKRCLVSGFLFKSESSRG